MRLFDKAKLVISTAGIRKAYTAWLIHRMLFRRSPRLRISKNTYLGHWTSFSEFLSFQSTVPQEERLLMRRALASTANPVAFDVGANIGAFTCLMPTLGASEVHAFEPIPTTFCRLVLNVRDNRVTPYCKLNCLAVGSRPDLVTFQVEDKSAATNRLFNGQPMRSQTVQLQTVACTSLDAYCTKMGIREIAFLKIDVEGMEPHVLEGAMGLLHAKAIGTILIEICPKNLLSVGLSANELIDMISRTGYQLHALNQDGNLGERLTERAVHESVLINAVLVPMQ